MSGNNCYSSEIMKNNFILLFSTKKKNDKQYKIKLIPLNYVFIWK